MALMFACILMWVTDNALELYGQCSSGTIEWPCNCAKGHGFRLNRTVGRHCSSMSL